MKKLPIFNESEAFKNLFKSMNTEYTIFKSSAWEDLNIDLFGELINNGEVEVNDEDLWGFQDKDGFFRINGKTVLIYIRDQYPKFSDKNDGYKYHLMGCRTINTALNSNRKSRYVAKNTNFKNSENPEFLINIIDKETNDYSKRNLSVKLRVCKNCLDKSNYNDYKNSTYSVRSGIYENFNYISFFNTHETSRLAKLNFINYDSSAVNEYTKDFKKISEKYRSKKNWICENCKRDLSNNKLKKYLHTHHINHHKAHNKDWNLKALCIECHSDEPMHNFMKNGPAYLEFLKIKKDM